MERFLQQVLDGAINGSVYAFLALALVLVYRSTHVVNFAQGEMAMFTAYIAWALTERGEPMWRALLLTVAVAFVAGAATERVLIRRLYSSNPLPPIIVTIGLFITLNSLAAWIWASIGRPMPPLFSFGGDVYELPGGARLNGQEVTIVVALALVGIGLWLFLQRTRLGLAMRAIAYNPESSRLVGIDVGRLLMVGWGMAAATGALAGVLVAPKLTLAPNMMLTVFLYAVAAATLGGFDSPVGAIVGGLVVGLVETLSATYISFVGADMKLVVAIALIIVVLLVRPAGLFGTTRVARV